MSVQTVLPYQHPSNAFFAYLRLFKRRPRPQKGQDVPALATSWMPPNTDTKWLRMYRQACMVKDDGNLPILYPQILSLGMQLTLLCDPRFPFSAVGCVHQRNHVLQLRPIKAGEPVNIQCWFGESRPVKQGLEFDLNTRVLVENEPVWDGISTYLFRRKLEKVVELPPIAHMPEIDKFTDSCEWRVGANMGRRYAYITGDYNPIHVSSILAKLFKFPRAIIHGMWSAAACAGKMPLASGNEPVRYDIAFKGPVFLGTKVSMQWTDYESGKRFDLFCPNNPRPVLKGWIRPAGEGEKLL